MTFEEFSRLENHYNLKYNYWTDKLDNPDLSLYGYRKIEANVLFYANKLESLHSNAEGLTY